MRKLVILLLVLCLPLSGCFSHQHTLDSGYHVGKEEVYHQWYILYGFVPVGQDKDSGELAQTTKYRVTEKYTWLDVIMNITIPGFMGLGATRRTVIIEK